MSPSRLPPRTVHERCPSHGSSKPLTTQLPSYGLIIRRQAPCPLELGVPLLMAVQMYKFQVAAGIHAALAPWLFVVAVQLLSVEEFHPADRTGPVLELGQ